MKNKQLSFCEVKDLEDEALNFIHDELSGKDTVFVGFSGGKDSIVTADLMRSSGIKHQLYYSVTGIDPPDVVRFIKKEYPECIFIRSKKTFWEQIMTRNPPSKFSRWCCHELKEKPANKIALRHRVFGIRAEESTRRSKYQRITPLGGKRGLVYYLPVFRWSKYDIWEYIDSYKLPYPDLYDQGLSRIGCVVCPFHTNRRGSGHDFYKARYPRFFKLFEKKCRQWYEKREESGKEMFFDYPNLFIKNWYEDNVKYYKH